MKNNLLKKVRWLYSCLIFFTAACNFNDPYRKINESAEEKQQHEIKIENAYAAIYRNAGNIKSGYLVTRTGTDFTSETLRNLNRRDVSYSHCGIASIEHDSVFIYHALGGEFNPDQKIRRDFIVDFADPHNNKGFGIFSYNFTSGITDKLISIVKHYYNDGLMFDMKFDLATDDRMYCAEFVYKCLLQANDNKMDFQHSFIKDFEFIGVDDLFLQPKCELKEQIFF